MRAIRRQRRVLGASLALSMIVVGLGLGAWRSSPSLAWPTVTVVFARIDQGLVAAGFGIEQIAVTGYRKTNVDEVYSALALDQPASIIGFDLAAARKRLEALPWVRTAELSRTLPDGLSVRLEERQPFAVWQSRQLLYVIDREGRDLDPVGPNDFPTLPHIVGDGAATAAPLLLQALEHHPDIKARLGNALRVGSRRWTLKLRGGPDVLLPAGAPDEAAAIEGALRALDRLAREDRLLERQIDSIDLRLPDRIAVRLPDAVAAAWRDPGKARTASLTAPTAVGPGLAPASPEADAMAGL